MNKIIIIGRLTSDPNLKATSSGIAVCSFTVAVNRPKNSKGESPADFIPVVVWREQGESCAKYLTKGIRVAVCGALQSRTYEKDGIKRTIYEVQAERVEFLERKAKEDQPVDQKVEEFQDISDGDLPFYPG